MQRIVRWCRYHPKATGIGAAVLVLFVIIGAVNQPKKNDSKDTAAGGSPTPSSTGPASPSASIATPAAPTTSASSTVTKQLAQAPADTSQRSSQLATDVLATLAIKGRAPKTGYSRAQFGSAWTDANDNPLGRNGCDTRNDILRRDLVASSLKSDSNGCTVLTGTLHDPYTNKSIAFIRGQSTSSNIQIDHVVALSDAWQKGAQAYTERTRTDLANDPLNLLAVDGPTNGAKGDGDAATWLPPNASYRCAYVARQVAVKARYKLWMTQAEHDATARILSSCPEQTVPAESGTPYLQKKTTAPTPKPTSRTTTRPPAPITSDPPEDVYYANCTEARAAGAAPIYRGEPGYSTKLDRDNDGVACES